jgi:hypothetical protein
METCSFSITQIPIPQKVVKANSVVINSSRKIKDIPKKYLAITAKITQNAISPTAIIPIAT